MEETSCPDENAFAELAAGTLGPQETAELERHLDRCPRCTALLGILGRVNDAQALLVAGRLVTQPPPNPEPSRRRTYQSRIVPVATRAEFVAEASVASVHGAFIALFAPLFWEGGQQAAPAIGIAPHASGEASLPALLIIGYAMVWGPVGLLWSCVTTWAWLQGRTWAKRASVIHTVLSLPFVCTLPLTAYRLALLVTRSRGAPKERQRNDSA